MEHASDLETLDKDLTVYPLVSDRYKSAFIDGMVMIGFWFLFSMIFSSIGNVSEYVKMAAYIFSVGFYDPICISLFGATIGHYSGGMKVVREHDPSKKPNFFIAVLRFAIKILLGIISLFTITKKNKGQAIHDMASGTLVLFTDPKILTSED